MKRKMSLAFVAGLLVAMVFTSCSKLREDFDFNFADESGTDTDFPFGFEDDLELWKERVAPMVEGCTTNYEKALAIYEWECANIAYDLSYSIYHAAECWEQKKGVCQAYSEMFVKLALGCGLEARLVSGKCKNGFSPDGEGGHAWVKVNTEKGWILIDATWGAGTVSYEFHFNDHDHVMAWFDVDPAIMIFTHFPSKQEHQLLSNPLTESQYKSIPELRPDVSFVGFDGLQVLNYFLSHPEGSLPGYPRYCLPLKDRIKLIEVPMGSNLKVGGTYTFKIKCIDTNLAIASSDYNFGWEEWEKEGDCYTRVLQPTSEMIQWNSWFQIVVHPVGEEENRKELLTYNTVE